MAFNVEFLDHLVNAASAFMSASQASQTEAKPKKKKKYKSEARAETKAGGDGGGDRSNFNGIKIKRRTCCTGAR